jgi:hypothetical protein
VPEFTGGALVAVATGEMVARGGVVGGAGVGEGTCGWGVGTGVFGVGWAEGEFVGVVEVGT